MILFLESFKVVSLFSYQCSLLSCAFCADLIILSKLQLFVNNFFHLFFNQISGEGGIWTLAPLLTTCTLSRGVPSASWVLLPILNPTCLLRQADIQFCLQKAAKRRGWDSNPCGVAPKRFSRPPRYDRFDTSPCRALCKARLIFYY